MTGTTETPAAGGAVTAPETTTAPSSETTQTTQQTAETTETSAETTTGAPDAAATGENEDDGKRKNRVPFNERIRQAVSRQRLAERERDRALERADRAERRNAELQRVNTQELDYRQRDDLDAEYRENRREARRFKEEARYAEEDIANAAHEARRERNELFVERIREAEKATPGLYDRFNAVPITEVMAQFVAESDLGVELARLMADPKERATVDQIIDLTFSDPRNRVHPSQEDVARAHRMLARMEARIDKAPSARKPTNAPHPGTTLNGKGATQTVSLLDLAAKEEGTAEYIRRRQEAWKKGGY